MGVWVEEETQCAQFTGLLLMPLRSGPGSEWNCEQNPVVQVWQDVTFLGRCLRQQVLAGDTPCPTLP